MGKQLLLFLLLITSGLGISQEITRFEISGKITASKGEDVEGINIYNKSSQKGTITSETGEFQIKVAENDRVFILMGASHTAFFRDFISRSPKYEMVNTFEYLK